MRDGKLARFDDGWRALEGPDLGRSGRAEQRRRSRCGLALEDGSAGAELWRHGKKEAGRVATLPTPPPADLSLMAQRDGTVWITGATRRLISVARDGTATTSVLDAAWLVTPEMKVKPVCRALTANGCCEADASAGQVSCGRVQAFERDGSMWFWSTGSSNAFVLPGLLQLLEGYASRRGPRRAFPTPSRAPCLPFDHHALLSAQSALSSPRPRDRRTVTPEPFPPLKAQTPQDILSLHRSGSRHLGPRAARLSAARGPALPRRRARAFAWCSTASVGSSVPFAHRVDVRLGEGFRWP
jgi:hypothetical protein